MTKWNECNYENVNMNPEYIFNIVTTFILSVHYVLQNLAQDIWIVAAFNIQVCVGWKAGSYRYASKIIIGL